MSKVAIQAVILNQETIGPLVKRLTFEAPAIAQTAQPGQFVHIRVSESFHPLLRRPISIADADANRGTVTVIYRVVGQGTALLAGLEPNDIIDCMGPLGRGFDLSTERPLLVGGGLGLAPLVYLAKTLCPVPITLLMGGRTREELYWRDIFAGVCRHTHITTDDGSVGRRGLTLDLLPDLLADGGYNRVYACGPRPMLEGAARLAAQFGVRCQVSLEDHMACGVGACLSCTCAGADGQRRKVCADGPVFWAEEVFASC